MKDRSSRNLLASIAVFGELCNTEQDIQSIIIEFIKSVYVLDKEVSLTTIDLQNLLRKHYSFDFPEAVVRSCTEILRKKKQVERFNGRYNFIDKSYDSKDFSQRIQHKNEVHKNLQENLLKYYEETTGSSLNDEERKKLNESFLSFLYDNGVDEKFTQVINKYILKNSDNEGFKNTLNQIKEGIILTNGLKYTSDIKSLGRWTEELNIYLDTEIIFNAFGYNGTVYKVLFDDFYSLVHEINRASHPKKIINLKYFEETKQEIDDYFYVAQRVVNKEQSAAPASTAMLQICKGCVSIEDVIFKKSQLESALISMGIRLVQDPNYIDSKATIIESFELLDKYSVYADESNITKVLESFSKINYLRRGDNNVSFDKCRHIILTGKNLSLRLSQDLEIKDEVWSIPFCTDINFITSRFWFKLNKGFSKESNLPATLDVITKAQIVLSSQINRSIEDKYNQLNQDLISGKLTKEQAQNYYYNLREKSKKPEDLNSQNIDSSLDVIYEDNFDFYEREQAYKDKQIQDGKEAIKKLKEMKFNALRDKRVKIKRKVKRRRVVYNVSIITAILMMLGLGAFIIIKTTNSTDSYFSIIIGIVTVVSVLWPLFRFKKIKSNLECKVRGVYKKMLQRSQGNDLS